MKFIIPGEDIPALNGNKVYKANQWVRARRAAAAHDIVRAHIWQQLNGKPEPFSGPVVVTIAVYSHHPPDVDSVVKLTLDGIVWAGLLVDDGYKYVPDTWLKTRRSSKKNARIEIKIEAFEGDLTDGS